MPVVTACRFAQIFYREQIPVESTCIILQNYRLTFVFLWNPWKNKIKIFLFTFKRDTKTEKNTERNLSSSAAENFLSRVLIGVICERSSHLREILLNVEDQ